MGYRTVTMDWDGYEIYDPKVAGPLSTLPRAEARGAFDRLMSEKRARIEMLGRLLKANGVELRSSDIGVQELNDWFITNVEADPTSPGRLLPDWYSVVNDVALFLGDVMIERSPGLNWAFFTGGRRDVAYQRHVIMGFRGLPNPRFNIDIDRNVATYAHRIVASRGSVASNGSRKVRGVVVDVDGVAASDRDRDLENGVFGRWVKIAESKG